MSVSTQQIQTVLRTYNKQLRLSGLDRKDINKPQRYSDDRAARCSVGRKWRRSKQQDQRKDVPNRY